MFFGGAEFAYQERREISTRPSGVSGRPPAMGRGAGCSIFIRNNFVQVPNDEVRLFWCHSKYAEGVTLQTNNEMKINFNKCYYTYIHIMWNELLEKSATR